MARGKSKEGREEKEIMTIYLDIETTTQRLR